MGDDLIGRLFDKLDKQNARLARIEAILVEREKRCDEEHRYMEALQTRVGAMEKQWSILDGGKGVIAWAVAMGIACYAALKHA